MRAQDVPLTRGIKTIVIDPGHGGKDIGCQGSKVNEKAITLAIALRLGAFIEQHYPGIRVIYTRKTDVFVELDERAQIANRNNADLFICVHANAGPKTAHGAETFVLGLHRTEAQRKIAERENSSIRFEEGEGVHYEQLSADAIIARQLQLSVFLDHSINFAAKIQQQFVAIGRSDRGVRQAGFLVLYKTTMPSVLIEAGFLTHPGEEKFLSIPDNQQKMASAIFNALEQYKAEYERADSVSTPTEPPAELPTEHSSSDHERAASIPSEEITFRVQIETAVQPLDLKRKRFRDLSIWTYRADGLYKYTVGLFDEIDSANQLKSAMRQRGFKHAFVVAFRAGERIPLQEAVKSGRK